MLGNMGILDSVYTALASMGADPDRAMIGLAILLVVMSLPILLFPSQVCTHLVAPESSVTKHSIATVVLKERRV